MKHHFTGSFFILLCLFTLTFAVETNAEESAAALDLSQLKELDLETAQKIALAANPTMLAAQARVEQARARVHQATSTWWPSLDVTGSGQKQRQSDTIFAANQALASLYGRELDQTTDDFALGLQASWILFDGFARNFREKQAQFGEKAFVFAHRDGQRLLLLSVAEAFFNAQLKQTTADIAAADSLFYDQQLRDAQNRFDAGAGPWGDVLNIKVQKNSAQTSLLLAKREYEAAVYGLAALLGIDDAKLPEQTRLQKLDPDCVINSEDIKTEKMIQQALDNRPDIQRLEMENKQAEAGTGLAKAPFYPRFEVAGALNGTRQGDVSMTDEDFGNMIGVNMAWNIFSGGLDKARLFEAKQRQRELDLQLNDVRNNISAQVRQNIALLMAATEQVRLQRDSVKLVEENRELAKNEYEAGEASLVRLNEAQRDLNATYSRLAQALVSYQRAQQQLLATTGEILDRFLPKEQLKKE